MKPILKAAQKRTLQAKPVARPAFVIAVPAQKIKWIHRSHRSRDCESIHNFMQTTLLDATIFKHVILAWMPESSAMDGNHIIINNNFFSTRFHIPVTGFQHPCWNDGVFSNRVAVIAVSLAIG